LQKGFAIASALRAILQFVSYSVDRRCASIQQQDASDGQLVRKIISQLTSRIMFINEFHRDTRAKIAEEDDGV
jgi:hypothetical protein